MRAQVSDPSPKPAGLGCASLRLPDAHCDAQCPASCAPMHLACASCAPMHLPTPRAAQGIRASPAYGLLSGFSLKAGFDPLIPHGLLPPNSFAAARPASPERFAGFSDQCFRASTDVEGRFLVLA